MENKNTMPANRLAVTYIRVSTKRQDDEGFSPEAQFKILNTYAKREGIKIVREFQEATSARKEGRSKFNEMVQFLESQPVSNPVKIILAEKSDRLSRNIFDGATLERLRQTFGLEVHYVKEGSVLNKESLPAQKFMGNIQSAVNSFYSDNLSLMVSKGMNEKASQGLHPTKAPFGYMNVSRDGQKLIEPDPLRSHYIKRIFELMATGDHSMLSILNLITAEGLRTKKGKKISKSHLQAIFDNPTHCGSVRYAGKIYAGTHEAIISQDLFDKVHMVMKSRTPRWRTERKGLWAFQGLITCGHCGCSVVGEKKTNKYGRGYTYYHCTRNKGKCPEKYISEKMLADLFRSQISKVQLAPDAVAYVRQGLLNSHNDQQDFQKRSLDALNLRYKTLGKLIEQGYEDSVSGVIEVNFYDRKRLDWRNEQIEIETKLAQFRQADDSYIQTGLQILELSKEAVNIYDSLDMAGKRELIGFVHSNFSLKDGLLTPSYRKPFDYIVRFAEKENAAPDLLGVENGVNPSWLAD